MIRWDWNPSRVVFIDFETQSAVNLREAGSRRYLSDPSTRLLSAVALLGNRLIVWVPPGRAPDGVVSEVESLWPVGFDRTKYTLDVYAGAGIPPELLAAIEAGDTFVAHNAAGFDAECWARLVGDPQPVWCDTLPSARAAGLPGSLDELGKRFLGRGKDDGAAALKLLYTAKRKGDRIVYPVGTVALWRSMLRYNVADVLLLERVWQHVGDYGEADVLDVHTSINNRGVRVDTELLQHLRELWAQLQGAATEKFHGLTESEDGRLNVRSTPQVKKWLASLGLQVDSLNRKELERLYADPEGYFGDVPDDVDLTKVVEVLRARQTATRISTGKIDRLAEMVRGEPDGRVRNVLVYWGAHTGRWSGRGFQPHNLAKGVSDLDVEACLAAFRAGHLTLDWLAAQPCKGNPSVDDKLSTLFRPVLIASEGCTFAIIDYASIEARGIAWIAGQEDLLQMFREGADTYCHMASKVFGRPITKKDKDERQLGKIIVLGSGYGMGANKFALFCKLNRIDLAAAGVTAEQCIEAYRDAFPKIAGERPKGAAYRVGGVWRDLERAARSAIESKGKRTPRAGRCRFYWIDGRLEIELPSGRRLVYRDARIEDRVPGYAKLLGGDMRPKATICYTHHHGYEGHLYGGLIAENVVQADCRDVLATALVRVEGETSLATVLHVHDEIVAECEESRAEESLATLANVMSDPPDWAAGFPIGVEGFTAPRYVKAPFKGAFHVERK